MKRTGNILTFLCLIAVVAGAAKYFYSSFQLRQYGQTTTAIIDQVKLDHKHEELTWRFRVNGKNYTGSTTLLNPAGYRKGDTIKIQYSLKNPSVNQIRLAE
jgi:hypothetical protein